MFIAEGDEFDVEGDAGFGDFDYGDADDAEDDFDAEGFEGLGDQLGAGVWGGHFGGLGGIGAEVEVVEGVEEEGGEAVLRRGLKAAGEGRDDAIRGGMVTADRPADSRG